MRLAVPRRERHASLVQSRDLRPIGRRRPLPKRLTDTLGYCLRMSRMGQPDDHADGDSEAAEVTALRHAERRLQLAQLASDVSALDQLIDDRLVFTGPDGKLYTKQDDLDVHRSGQQSMTRVDEEDLAVLVVGRTGLTWFLGTVEGAMAGEPFRARVRYTRTWIYGSEGWKLVAAHISSADVDTASG
jgi:hypothetical protein